MHRVNRFKVMDACCKLTPEIVDLWARWLHDENFSAVFRNNISLQIMAYAIGRPSQQLNIESNTQSTELQYTKVIHEVRWLPPDPTDRSVEIKPEPDGSPSEQAG
jgi:hypothetical protein